MPVKRIIILFLAFLAVLLGSTWFVLRHTQAAESIVRQLLDDIILSPSWDIESASFEPQSATVTVRGLWIRPPELGADRALFVDELTIGLGADLSIRKARAKGLQLEIRGDGTNVWDLLDLDSDPDGEPALFPVLTIEDATVRFHLSADRSVEFEKVSISAGPETEDPAWVAIKGSASLGSAHGTIAGRMNPETEAVRASVELGAFDLRSRLESLLGANGGETLDANRIQGRVAQTRAWFTSMAGETSWGAVLDLDGVGATPAAFPYPLADGAGQVKISHEHGGSATLIIDGPETLPIHVEASAHGLLSLADSGCELRGSLDSGPLPVDNTLLGALRAADLGDVPGIISGLNPQGGTVAATASLFTTLREDRLAGSNERTLRVDPIDVEATLNLDGIGARFDGLRLAGRRPVPGFPVPLENIRGQVALLDRTVEIRNLEADVPMSAGGGDLTLTGFVPPAGAPTLRFRSPSLAFHKAVRDAIDVAVPSTSPGRGALGQRIWSDFRPEGRAKAAVDIYPGGLDVRLEILGAAAQWSGLRLPLAEVKGPLRVRVGHRPDREPDLRLDLDLRGTTQDSSLRVRAVLDKGAGRRRLDLSAKAEKVTLDDQLARALQDAGYWVGGGTKVQFDGKADLDMKLWQVGREDADFDLRIALDNAGVDDARIQIPITQVRGTFLLEQREDLTITVPELHGMVPTDQGEAPASVHATGSATIRDATAVAKDVTIVARDLSLSPRLIMAFAGVDPDAQRPAPTDPESPAPPLERTVAQVVAEDFGPSGRVDVTYRLLEPAVGQDRDERYEVELRGLNLDSRFLPGRATELVGHVVVENGDVQFDELSAKLRGVPITVRDGRLSDALPETHPLSEAMAQSRRGPEAYFYATVEAHRPFPVDAELARLIQNDEFRKTFLSRNLVGDMRFALDVVFAFPETPAVAPDAAPGHALRLGMTGDLTPQSLEFDLGPRLRDYNGTIALQSAIIDAERSVIRGRIRENTYFTMLGQQITDVKTGFELTADNVRFSDTTFRLHGGEFRPATADEDAIAFRFDPQRLAANLRWQGMNLSQLLEHTDLRNQNLEALIDGEFRLIRLDGADFLNMRAAGSVDLTQADLGDVPLFAGLYLGADRPKFDSANVRFTISDQKLRVEKFSAGSSLLEVGGSGSLDFDGHLDLVARGKLLSREEWLLIPAFLNLVTGNIFRVHIFGNVRNVELRSRAFTQRDPKRPRLRPIPPRRRDA